MKRIIKKNCQHTLSIHVDVYDGPLSWQLAVVLCGPFDLGPGPLLIQLRFVLSANGAEEEEDADLASKKDALEINER